MFPKRLIDAYKGKASASSTVDPLINLLFLFNKSMIEVSLSLGFSNFSFVMVEFLRGNAEQKFDMTEAHVTV